MAVETATPVEAMQAVTTESMSSAVVTLGRKISLGLASNHHELAAASIRDISAYPIEIGLPALTQAIWNKNIDAVSEDLGQAIITWHEQREVVNPTPFEAVSKPPKFKRLTGLFFRVKHQWNRNKPVQSPKIERAPFSQRGQQALEQFFRALTESPYQHIHFAANPNLLINFQKAFLGATDIPEIAQYMKLFTDFKPQLPVIARATFGRIQPLESADPQIQKKHQDQLKARAYRYADENALVTLTDPIPLKVSAKEQQRRETQLHQLQKLAPIAQSSLDTYGSSEHPNNQDRTLIREYFVRNSDGSVDFYTLMGLSDGMTLGVNGARDAELAIFLLAQAPLFTTEELHQKINEILYLTNALRSNPDQKGVGATLCVALVKHHLMNGKIESTVDAVSIGDSRVYLTAADGTRTPLSTDHVEIDEKRQTFLTHHTGFGGVLEQIPKAIIPTKRLLPGQRLELCGDGMNDLPEFLYSMIMTDTHLTLQEKVEYATFFAQEYYQKDTGGYADDASMVATEAVGEIDIELLPALIPEVSKVA